MQGLPKPINPPEYCYDQAKSMGRKWGSIQNNNKGSTKSLGIMGSISSALGRENPRECNKSAQ